MLPRFLYSSTFGVSFTFDVWLYFGSPPPVPEKSMICDIFYDASGEESAAYLANHCLTFRSTTSDSGLGLYVVAHQFIDDLSSIQNSYFKFFSGRNVQHSSNWKKETAPYMTTAR